MTIDIISDNTLIIPEYIINVQNKSKKTIELVEAVISEISAESISDMGEVMSMVMQKSGGKVDGGIANRIARELLQ